jgi:hypothetical protein
LSGGQLTRHRWTSCGNRPEQPANLQVAGKSTTSYYARSQNPISRFFTWIYDPIIRLALRWNTGDLLHHEGARTAERPAEDVRHDVVAKNLSLNGFDQLNSERHLRYSIYPEVSMPNRNLVSILAVLAVVLVVLPLLGMIGMMATGTSCCAGMMRMSGSVIIGMSAMGLIWMLAAAAVVIALVVLLVRAVAGT